MRVFLFTNIAIFFVLNLQTVIAQDINLEQSELIERFTIWGSPNVTEFNSILDKEIIELDFTNVADALSVIPGVSLQMQGKRNEAGVKVRGFNSKQVPIFLDGIPIYVPYDGNIDLNRILTSDITRIEVAKGYSSLLQGPNMLGGAINLITKKPIASLQGKINFDQGWANKQTNAYKVGVSIGASNDFGFIYLNGSQYERDFLGLSQKLNSKTVGGSQEQNILLGVDGKMLNSASEDVQGSIKFGFTPNDNDKYTFTYINQQGSKDSIPYAGDFYTDKNDKSILAYWHWPEYNKESFYYSGLTQLTEKIQLSSRVYHDKFNNTLLMYKEPDRLEKNIDVSKANAYSTGASTQLSLYIDDDLLSFAAHWKDDVHKGENIKYKKNNGKKFAEIENFKDRTFSISSEYQHALNDSISLVGGVSYDLRKSITSELTNLDTGKTVYYDDNEQKAFNWQLLTSYEFNETNLIKFSVSERSRFPTIKERYSKFKVGSQETVEINPHLKPEKALILDISYQGCLNNLINLDTSIYYNQLNDAILTQIIDENKGKKIWKNINSGRVDYAGLDLGLHTFISDSIDINLNYTYTHANVYNDHLDVTGIPKHELSAWLTYKPIESLKIILSEELRTETNSSTSEPYRKAKGFAVTNFNISYTPISSLKLKLAINNLFDKAYAYNEGFYQEGLNYWLGIEYQFSR